MQTAYVAYQPDLAAPQALAIVTALFEQAVQSGVRRLVLLSGRGEVEAQQAECALQASGADGTILRCSWFCQNFSEGFLLESILAGEVALPVSTVREPIVDADDIADVAVAALTQPGHSGQLHELTGSQAVTFAAAVVSIAQATQREIRFMSISPEEFRSGLQAVPLSAAEVDLITYLFTTVLDGRNERVSDGVQRVLGRPARSFADYVQRASANGARARVT